MNRPSGCVLALLLLGACDDDVDQPIDLGMDDLAVSDLASGGDAPAADGACGDACSTAPTCDRCATPFCALGALGCAAADTDGDGLQDAWETQGYVDVNCNGVNDGEGIDVQLPGADSAVPDVYLEIDYLEMPGSGAACTTDAACNGAVPGESCVAGACTHSHKPRQASLDIVRLAAARGLSPLPGDPAPPADLAGKPGFRLHFDGAHSNAIAETATGGPEVVSFGTSATSRVLDATCVGPNAQHYFDLKDANFFHPAGANAFYEARRRVYHYAIASHYSSCPPDAMGGNNFCNNCPGDRGGGHPQAGASGTSEVPGNDFMISLGDQLFGIGVPSAFIARVEAGTVLHELGHNLGLMHGVAEDPVTHVRSPSLVPEYSPIYFSVMNYNYQSGVLFASAPGSKVPSSSRIDFSDDTTCADLDESALTESNGAQCGASTTRVIRYIPGTGVPAFGSATTGSGVDWDNDGTLTSTPEAVDLNGINATGDTFHSFNDWAYAGGKFLNLLFASNCSPYSVQD